MKTVQLDVSRIGHQTIYKVTAEGSGTGQVARDSGWLVGKRPDKAGVIPDEAHALAAEWCGQFGQTFYNLLDHRSY